MSAAEGGAGGGAAPAYFLEKVTLEEDSDDSFEYEEVAVGSDDSGDDLDLEEDFEAAMRTIQARVSDLAESGTGDKDVASSGGAATSAPAAASLERKPEVVDDFIRNFLVKKNFAKTLDAFQSEWYQKAEWGDLNEEDIEVVPDVYRRNEQLDDNVVSLRKELGKAQEIAEKARGTWDKFRKERDFHRMHHKRVVQEKNKLIVDIKRLKKHCSTYEPTLKELQHKYEVAMKEKMLMRLERDKLLNKVETLSESLNTQLRQNAVLSGESASETGSPRAGTSAEVSMGSVAGRNRATVRSPRGGEGLSKSTRDRQAGKGGAKASTKRGSPTGLDDVEDTMLPADDRENPWLHADVPAAALDKFVLSKTFKGHDAAISSVAVHPRKSIVATASDDMTWKMWNLPDGELIMSGDGHKDWVGGIDFHPHGTHLITASGDSTVKIWDFATSSCRATLTDHTQAVWSCAFHDTGDFFVSASLDHTARLWDTWSLRCRQTFRGHVDSVNSIVFQPYTNNVCTGSGDKTISLWDCRSGLCIQTFYGHSNSVNCVAFNLRGDTIASTDADGVIKLWDVRMVSETNSINAGPYPVNKCTFDQSGSSVCVASDTGSILAYSVSDGAAVAELTGHEDAAQSVAFDNTGKFLISTSSDNTFRTWS